MALFIVLSAFLFVTSPKMISSEPEVLHLILELLLALLIVVLATGKNLFLLAVEQALVALI